MTGAGTKGAVHAVLTLGASSYSLGKSTEMPEAVLKKVLRYYRKVAHVKRWRVTEKVQAQSRRGSPRGGRRRFPISDP